VKGCLKCDRPGVGRKRRPIQLGVFIGRAYSVFRRYAPNMSSVRGRAAREKGRSTHSDGIVMKTGRVRPAPSTAGQPIHARWQRRGGPCARKESPRMPKRRKFRRAATVPLGSGRRLGRFEVKHGFLTGRGLLRRVTTPSSQVAARKFPAYPSLDPSCRQGRALAKAFALSWAPPTVPFRARSGRPCRPSAGSLSAACSRIPASASGGAPWPGMPPGFELQFAGKRAGPPSPRADGCRRRYNRPGSGSAGRRSGRFSECARS